MASVMVSTSCIAYIMWHNNEQGFTPDCCKVLTVINVTTFFISLVMIVDPGINIDPGYIPYDRGLQQDVFLKVGVLKRKPSTKR